MEDYVREYLDSFDEKLAQLRSLIVGREAEAVKAFGHRLKGSGATYGFDAITELGRALEEAARKVIDNAERRADRIAQAQSEGALPATPATPSRLPPALGGAVPGGVYLQSSGEHVADAAAWADIESLYAKLSATLQKIRKA